MNRREELAWAAGLFDGEGFVGVLQNKGRRYLQARIGISQNDRRVLDEFARIIGFGTIYGPYLKTGKKNPSYEYAVIDFNKTQAVIAMIWPWLRPVKRQQATDALRSARETWLAAKKTECKNGHALIPENRYPNRTCRLCAVEKTRRYRLRLVKSA